MCEAVIRFLSCMNIKEEERIKTTPRIKYKDAPRHIRKRIEAKPNTYVKDNRLSVQENESTVTSISEPFSSTLGPRSTSLLLNANQQSVLNLHKPLCAKSKSIDMGKLETMAFDNLTMLGFNGNNFSTSSWKTKATSLTSLSAFSEDRPINEIVSSADGKNPSNAYAINTLLSCTPSQRYTGLSPLIPKPNQTDPASLSTIVSKEKHRYVNTAASGHLRAPPDNTADRDWGWLSVSDKTSECKKPKMSAHSFEKDGDETLKQPESNVIEYFVSPAGVAVFIKSTKENNFKTESWKHLVALLGGGKVTFALARNNQDSTMQQKKQEDEHENQNYFQSMPEDADNYFNISKKAYYKLISYCQANKLNLREDFLPEYCKNRARLSARSQKKETHFKQLLRVLETVEECAWYWGSLSGNDAKSVLNKASPGTFLLRDSSDPRYLYSLSIKTRKGPTSIRIVYKDNTFQFDSDMEQNSCRQDPTKLPPDHPNYVAKRQAPVCNCVIGMILRYTKHNRIKRSKTNNMLLKTTDGDPPPPEQFMCYWVSRAGRQEIPVILDKPLPKRLPTLQELCRINVAKQTSLWKDKSKISSLPLPVVMKKFLIAYPYPA